MVKQRAEYFQNLLNDHSIAFFCRVNAISLVQGGRGGQGARPVAASARQGRVRSVARDRPERTKGGRP